jgi:hypothetical protein
MAAGGWVHHEHQRRRKWVPTAVKLTVALAVGAYFAFMLSFTQGGSGEGAGAGAGGGLQSALTSLATSMRRGSAGTTEGAATGAGRGGGAGGSKKKNVIGYAISVTADGPYMDGAAVLAHGIRKAMAASKYDFDLVALVYPNVTTSRAALQRAGWK